MVVVRCSWEEALGEFDELGSDAEEGLQLAPPPTGKRRRVTSPDAIAITAAGAPRGDADGAAWGANDAGGPSACCPARAAKQCRSRTYSSTPVGSPCIARVTGGLSPCCAPAAGSAASQGTESESDEVELRDAPPLLACARAFVQLLVPPPPGRRRHWHAIHH